MSPDPVPQVEQQAPAESRVPDTLLILLALAVVAWAATWLFRPGRFATVGSDPVRVLPGSFERAAGIDGAPLFAGGEGTGLVDFLFAGLVSGGPTSAAVGLMAFILVIGGTFGVIMRTGAVDAALAAALPGGKVANERLVAGLFVAFSAAGAIFGMGEEAIAISLILVPALIRAGYDSITTLLCCYVATQVGFATSWMNPFSVVVAQGIAGVPPMSGMAFRIAMWAGFTAIGTIYVVAYARRVRLNPKSSIAHTSDAAQFGETAALPASAFNTMHALVLAILAAGIAWVGWGVIAEGYYFAEIAAQFFAVGILAGVVAWLHPASRLSANSLVEAFRDGAVQLAPAGLVVAAAKGIVLILGGDDPAQWSLLNSLLDAMGALTGLLPDWLTAWGMLAFQSVINVFIVSGSGQASITMPLMAPLADLSGVSRQTAVLAFQLGDGITNVIVPSSAALMGCLAAAKLDYVTWLRFFWKPMAGLFVLESLTVLFAHASGFQ